MASNITTEILANNMTKEVANKIAGILANNTNNEIDNNIAVILVNNISNEVPTNNGTNGTAEKIHTSVL